MGGGVSSSQQDKPKPPEARGFGRRGSWSNVPVTFADLQTNGKEEHRIDEHAVRHRGSITTDYGRISPTRQIFKSTAQLEVQAAAHWHRIISHAKDQRNDAVSEMLGELMQKPKCPECARGNPRGPMCPICGRDATDDLAAAAAAAAGGSPALSSSASSSPSPSPNSNLVPRVGWNTATKSYDRLLVNRLLSADNILDSASTQPSPTHVDDCTAGSQHSAFTTGTSSPYKDVDFTDEDTHMAHILRSLLETEGLKRSKDRKSYVEKMAAKAEGSPQEQEAEAERARRAFLAVPPSPLAALRKNKGRGQRRKFMGMGLDSDDDSEGDEKGGSSKEQRSKYADQYESDQDLEEAGVGPFPPLPPVEIGLKRRTATSITVAWDISSEMLELLQAVQATYGKNKMPIYQLQFRLHTQNQTPNLARTDAENAEDGWQVGCKRTMEASATVEGLVSNTPYAFRCLRKGWGPWGPAVVIRSGPGAPSAPRILVAKEVTSTSVLMTWQAPERDNGLPVNEYLVRMKTYQGCFETVFRGRERCFQTTNLACNTVHIFEVQAGNKAGTGAFSERLAVRTLPHGAAPMTPWIEAIDEKTEKLYYCHPKSNAVAWTLPKGALVDDVASFRSKRAFLLQRFERTMQEVCKARGVVQKVMTVQVR